MMRYFQTDDRDDYFASLEKNNSKSYTSVTLVDPNGMVILKDVQTWKVRNYVKNNYPEFGNAKRIWRSAIESKGYKVNNNQH